MKTRFSLATLAQFGALFGVLSAACFAQACSSNDDEEPSPSLTGGTGGSAGTAGTGGTAGSAGAAGSAGTGGSTGSGGSAGDGGLEGGAGTGGATCVPVDAGASGCVPCPSSSDEFLNQCTKATCAKFDNFARIPGYTGTLPPL